MKKKMLMAAGVMTLSMGLLAGCGAPKPEEMVDKMFAEQADSFAATMEMDIDVNASLGAGMDVSLATSGKVDMEYSGADKDAPVVHTMVDVKYDVSAMGDSMSDQASTEMYTITSGDEITVYVQDPDDGSWMKEAAENTSTINPELADKIREEVAEVLKTGEVEKKAETVNGEECWVLKLNTNADSFMGVYDILVEAAGEEVQDAMAGSGVDTQMIENYLSYFNMDLTAYASTKTGQLVKMDVDMSKMDTDGLLNQVNGDFGELFAYIGIDMSSVSLDVNGMSFSTTFTQWDNVEVSVPEEVVAETSAE